MQRSGVSHHRQAWRSFQRVRPTAIKSQPHCTPAPSAPASTSVWTPPPLGQLLRHTGFEDVLQLSSSLNSKLGGEGVAVYALVASVDYVDNNDHSGTPIGYTNIHENKQTIINRINYATGIKNPLHLLCPHCATYKSRFRGHNDSHFNMCNRNKCTYTAYCYSYILILRGQLVRGAVKSTALTVNRTALPGS